MVSGGNVRYLTWDGTIGGRGAFSVSLRVASMLCEVDRSYIEDGFNLYGLRHHFSNFQGCLDIILDRTGERPVNWSVARLVARPPPVVR